MFFEKEFHDSFKAGLLTVTLLVSSTCFGMTMVEYGDSLPKKVVPDTEDGVAISEAEAEAIANENSKFDTFFTNIDAQLKDENTKKDYDKRLKDVADLMKVEITDRSAILATNLVGGLTGESGVAYGAYSDHDRYPTNLEEATSDYNGLRNAVHPGHRPMIMRCIRAVAKGLVECNIMSKGATESDIESDVEAARTYCNGYNSILAQQLSCLPDFENLRDFFDDNKLGLSITKFNVCSGFGIVLDDAFKDVFSILVYIYRDGLENNISYNSILTFINSNPDVSLEAKDLNIKDTSVKKKLDNIKEELVKHIKRLGPLEDLGFTTDFDMHGNKIYEGSVYHYCSIFNLHAKNDKSFVHKNEFRFACQAMLATLFGNKLPAIKGEFPCVITAESKVAKFTPSDLYIDVNTIMTDMTGPLAYKNNPLYLYWQTPEIKKLSDETTPTIGFSMAMQALKNAPIDKSKSAFFRTRDAVMNVDKGASNGVNEGDRFLSQFLLTGAPDYPTKAPPATWARYRALRVEKFS